MKIKLFILSLLLWNISSAQYPISQNGYLNLNGHQYGWSNGTDTIGKMYIDRAKFFKPVLPGIYTTATRPSATIFAGSWIYNSDSNKMYYSNGSAWTDPASSIATSSLTSVSAGLGMNFPTITTSGPVIADTAYLQTRTTNQVVTGRKDHTGIFNATGGGNVYVQGGNAFGATAVIGTTDNNPLIFRSNGVNVMEIFADGNMLIGNSGTDGGQRLQVPGTMALGGTITTTAGSGFSIGSGNNFSSFGANNSGSGFGFYWGINNPFGSGVKSFMAFVGDASLSSGTSSVNQLAITPTYNNSGAGTYTVRGVYYNPTLTSLTNTTHIAFQNVTGDNLFNSTSGKTTFSGLVNHAAPTASVASANFAAGTFPTSPIQGDFGAVTGHLYYRDGSTTYDLLAPVGGATIYSGDGTLSSNRTVANGGFDLSFSGTGKTKLLSPVLLGQGIAGDANYTIGSESQVLLTTGLTASRTLTIPSAITYPGRIITIVDSNTSAFAWLSSATLWTGNLNAGINSLPNGSVITIISTGNNWVIQSIQYPLTVQITQGTLLVTAGSSSTMLNSISNILFDPPSALANYTLTLPPNPVDGQLEKIHSGGTIIGSAAVVTVFTVSPNAGQTIIQRTAPTTLLANDCLIYQYYNAGARWYREQ